MKKVMLGAFVFAALMGLSSQSSAQSTRGLWIAGGAEAFRVVQTTLSPPGFREYSTTIVGFGLFGSDVGVGYQFNEHFLLGGRFGFGWYQIENLDTVTSGRLSLHIEIPFLTGQKRPFIMIEPGLVTNTNLSSLGLSRQESGFRGVLGGGVHLFVTDSFSISPFGALTYQNVSERYASDVGFTVGALISGWVWKK